MEDKVLNTNSRARLIDILLLVIIAVIHFIILSKYNLHESKQVLVGWGAVKALYPSVVSIFFGYLFLKIFIPSMGYNGTLKRLTLVLVTLLARYFFEGIDLCLGSGSWYNILGATLGAILLLSLILLRSFLVRKEVLV